ncbi:MAG TPA: glycosyltransferase [Thermoanaerobaculia bacterium]|nr:glycosyltransferase [Thermoanaerobaculia bacterium]
MHLSVVIGTFNRALLLEGTLRALAEQRVPESLKWEIVVVDNNSRDETARVVAAFVEMAAVPTRRFFEPQQGLSHARNRGLREARGSLIAFIDDDVLPAPDWVAQIAAAIDRWDALGVGGRILPRWESAPPRWLAENPRLLDRLAVMDFEEGRLLALPLDPQPQVWGANMAFRRELFERVGGFDPRRGVVGARLFRGEESALIDRALELGLKIAYDPAPTVFHRIGPERMRKAYFRRVIFDEAQGRARATSPSGEWSLFGAPIFLYRAPFTTFARWAGSALLRSPSAFDRQLRIFGALGRLTGHWKAGMDRRVGEGLPS